MPTDVPPTYPVPWAVACVYRDEATGNIFQRLDMIPAHDQGAAAAQAVSMYYRSGGTMPLFSVMAVPVPEEMCRAAVAMYDETARLKKAEADKVVVGGFRVLSGEPAPDALSGNKPWPTDVAPPEGAA